MTAAMARTIMIGRSRMRRWLKNFAERHSGIDAVLDDNHVCVTADDGAVAWVQIPFAPMASADAPESPTGCELLNRLVAHIEVDRIIGAILVRRGGFAAGVFHGAELTDSKVGTGYVQGKTKAGGWSQQRYRRRRDRQARQLYDRAADAAETVLLSKIDELDAVATGGDSVGIAAVANRPRLSPLHSLLMSRVYPVADPRRRVLESFPEQFLAIRIELNDLA